MTGGLRIVAVSGTYPPDVGGAELSLHHMLVHLSRKGHEIVVVADERNQTRRVEGIRVLHARPSRLERVLDSVARSLRPSVAFAQMAYAREALCWAATRGLPSVLFLRTASHGTFLGGAGEPVPDIVVANSESVREAVGARWRGECMVVNPFVRQPRNSSPAAIRDMITFVNPVVSKGADRVRQLAISLPMQRFLVVRSWTGFRDKEGWSPVLWNRLARSQGLRDIQAPEEVFFGDLSNVEVMEATNDMDRLVYGRSRIVLCPSRIEPFGRVAVEALVRGIPVIASDIGGLAEALRGGGILIRDGDDIGAWVKAIDLLENEETYRAWKRAALEAGRRHDSVTSVSVFMGRLGELLSSRKLDSKGLRGVHWS